MAYESGRRTGFGYRLLFRFRDMRGARRIKISEVNFPIGNLNFSSRVVVLGVVLGRICKSPAVLFLGPGEGPGAMVLG